MNTSHNHGEDLRRVRLGVNDHGMIRLQIRLHEPPPAPDAHAPWHRRLRHSASRWLENIWGE